MTSHRPLRAGRPPAPEDRETHRRTAVAGLRSLGAETGRGLRTHDLALYSAGVTFYAGVAVVPSLLVAIRVATAIVGDARMGRLVDSLTDALPDALEAPEAVRQLFAAGTHLSWLTVVVALFPATLYGEGLRRGFVSLIEEREGFTGWRGRLLLLPLLGLAPVLLISVLLVTPLLADLFSGSIASGALGVYVSLNLDWIVLSVVLTYVYRVVGPAAPSRKALLWGAFTTGAFMSGFLQGFVLFLALPIDLGAPFGGLTGIGAVVATGFWLWLLHLLTLVGYALTWRLDARGGSPFVLPSRAVRASTELGP